MEVSFQFHAEVGGGLSFSQSTRAIYYSLKIKIVSSLQI